MEGLPGRGKLTRRAPPPVRFAFPGAALYGTGQAAERRHYGRPRFWRFKYARKLMGPIEQAPAAKK